MLLANKCLPYRNNIFKYVHVQIALPKKNFLMCCFCDEILLAGAAIPLFNSYK